MYTSHASPWPLNQHVWISRQGTCFWAGRSCMYDERSVKSVRRKAKHTHLKESRMRARFWTTQNAKIWSFIKTTHFICFTRHCCSLSYTSFSTWTSRHWGCINALSSPPFLRQALALSSSLPSQLLPFWRRYNETASAATALRINLCKCIQLFVNRMF